MEYIHLPEDEDIGPEGRSYRIKEEVLDYQGKKALCVNVEAGGGITFCDGSRVQTVNSIFVKGYITEWKIKRGEEQFVSRLEAINDPGDKQELRKILEAKYGTSSVYFDFAPEKLG